MSDKRKRAGEAFGCYSAAKWVGYAMALLILFPSVLVIAELGPDPVALVFLGIGLAVAVISKVCGSAASSIRTHLEAMDETP